MKYLLPLVVLLAVAGAAPARATFDCGPYLDEQMDQAKQSAIYDRELQKDQVNQAEQSALYLKELEKDQRAQMIAAAGYEKDLGREQQDQAKQAAAYEIELGKDEKAQAAQSAVYAKELSDHELAWRRERYQLCSTQSHKMAGTGGKMFDDAGLGPAPKAATAPASADAAAPAPAAASTGTTKANPADMNALTDKKTDLMKALKDIDDGK